MEELVRNRAKNDFRNLDLSHEDGGTDTSAANSYSQLQYRCLGRHLDTDQQERLKALREKVKQRAKQHQLSVNLTDEEIDQLLGIHCSLFTNQPLERQTKGENGVYKPVGTEEFRVLVLKKAPNDPCKKEEKEKENHSWYRVRDEKVVGKGKVTFVQGDFFDDAWLKEIGVPRNGFDVIYDYTFFCALNPELRPKWVLRHTELLASLPAGNLICLESPHHKDPLAPSPPFASPSKAYMEHLSHPSEKIPYNDKGLVNADPLQEPGKAAAGLERVAYWQPERTHTVGKDKNGVIHDSLYLASM